MHVSDRAAERSSLGAAAPQRMDPTACLSLHVHILHVLSKYCLYVLHLPFLVISKAVFIKNIKIYSVYLTLIATIFFVHSAYLVVIFLYGSEITTSKGECKYRVYIQSCFSHLLVLKSQKQFLAKQSGSFANSSVLFSSFCLALNGFFFILLL